MDENKGYLKWMFTRWYYYLIFLLVVSINPQIKTFINNNNYAAVLGYILGVLFVVGFIFYIPYSIRKK